MLITYLLSLTNLPIAAVLLATYSSPILGIIGFLFKNISSYSFFLHSNSYSGDLYLIDISSSSKKEGKACILSINELALLLAISKSSTNSNNFSLLPTWRYFLGNVLNFLASISISFSFLSNSGTEKLE